MTPSKTRDKLPHMEASSLKAPVVLKPTGTVQIANRFSLVERKVLNTLMYYAQQRRFSGDEHTLPISEVFYHIGLENSRNHQLLKDAIKKLVGTIIEWNVFGDDRVQEWGACTFLASGKLARGKIRFRLNPEIIEQITHPRLFAKIQLLIQAQFTRRHAMVLYEFLLDCVDRQKATELVIKEVLLEKLYRLTGLENSKYAETGNFKIFNRDIVKPAVAEINEHTDLQVTPKPIRGGRRVIALDFHVKRNSTFQVMLDLQTDVIDQQVEGVSPSPTPSNKPPAPSSTPLQDDQVKKDWQERLQRAGISSSTAKKFVATYPLQRIKANYSLFLKRVESGPTLDTPGAYLRKAIIEDYAEETDLAEQPVVFSLNPLAELNPALVKTYKTRWQKFRSEQIRKQFNDLDGSEQESLRQLFLKSGRLSAVNKDMIKKHGWNHPVIEFKFEQEFLSERLLKDPLEISLSSFIQAQEAKKTKSPRPDHQRNKSNSKPRNKKGRIARAAQRSSATENPVDKTSSARPTQKLIWLLND